MLLVVAIAAILYWVKKSLHTELTIDLFLNRTLTDLREQLACLNLSICLSIFLEFSSSQGYYYA